MRYFSSYSLKGRDVSSKEYSAAYAIFWLVKFGFAWVLIASYASCNPTSSKRKRDKTADTCCFLNVLIQTSDVLPKIVIGILEYSVAFIEPDLRDILKPGLAEYATLAIGDEF